MAKKDIFSSYVIQGVLVRFFYPLLEMASPQLAYRWARKRFFTPLRTSFKKGEKLFLSSAHQSEIFINDKKVTLYRWGKGPTIFMQHGWAGKASQFASFVKEFTDIGYCVVAADAPAHGNSGGKESDVFEFMKMNTKVILSLENLVGCVGHSLGGIVLLNLFSKKVFDCKLVLISMPTKSEAIVKGFSSTIGGSTMTERYLEDYVTDNYPLSIDALFNPKIATQKSSQVFLVYDKSDRQVRSENFEKAQLMLPKAPILFTDKLGHTRILFNQHIVKKVVAWLSTDCKF